MTSAQGDFFYFSNEE